MVESSTLSPGTRKRLSRIKRRAIPEVREAYKNGQISAKRADLLLYLRPQEQRAELERRLSEAKEREERHRRTAEVIKSYLNTLEGKRPDLHQLAGIIKAALS
jgi:hypothetical protein